jgi:phosphate-selective porin
MKEYIDNQEIKYKTYSQTKFMRDRYISDKIKNVDSISRSNFELFYINSKFSIQSEYVKVVTDALRDEYSFNSLYLEGSYFIYGKGRSYNRANSSLSKVKLNKSHKALEIAFRYSSLDLDDNGKIGEHPELGGTQIDYNYGLNYYFNKHLKIMFNYIVSKPKDITTYDGLLQVIQARLMYNF